MGNHRPLPYEGLHFSKNDPRNGTLSGVVTAVVSLLIAVAFLVGCAFLVTQLGLPVRYTEDGSSVFGMLKMIAGGLLP